MALLAGAPGQKAPDPSSADPSSAHALAAGHPLAVLATVKEPLTDLLAHADPVVRGEAALAVAATGDLQYYPAILAIARDRAPKARLRGILALGYLAAPGAEFFLGEVLLKSKGSRRGPEPAAAALALGLLPDEHPAPAIDTYLRQVRGGSYRKHRQTLAALLLGSRAF